MNNLPQSLPVRSPAFFTHYDDALAGWCAPRGVRPAIRLILRLNARLREVARAGKEPLLVDIKLAWWREQLVALDAGAAPAEPLLQAVAGILTPELTGALLSGLADEETRGGVLFVAIAQLCGRGDVAAIVHEAGQLWVQGKGQRAPHLGIKPLDLLLSFAFDDMSAAARSKPLASPAQRTLVALRVKLLGR